MNNNKATRNSTTVQLEKFLPHAIGAVIAIAIIIGTNTYGSAAVAAVTGFKAGAGGYLVGWLITIGGLKLYRGLRKAD